MELDNMAVEDLIEIRKKLIKIQEQYVDLIHEKRNEYGWQFLSSEEYERMNSELKNIYEKIQNVEKYSIT